MSPLVWDFLEDPKMWWLRIWYVSEHFTKWQQNSSSLFVFCSVYAFTIFKIITWSKVPHIIYRETPKKAFSISVYCWSGLNPSQLKVKTKPDVVNHTWLYCILLLLRYHVLGKTDVPNLNLATYILRGSSTETSEKHMVSKQFVLFF